MPFVVGCKFRPDDGTTVVFEIIAEAGGTTTLNMDDGRALGERIVSEMSFMILLGEDRPSVGKLPTVTWWYTLAWHLVLKFVRNAKPNCAVQSLCIQNSLALTNVV